MIVSDQAKADGASPAYVSFLRTNHETDPFLFQGKDGSRKASAPSREKIIAENFQPSHALGFFHALNAMIFSAVRDMPFSASLLFLDGLPFSVVRVGGKGRKQAGKIASAVWFCPCSCG